MNPGIRAELKLPVVVGCPMARVSETMSTTTYSVSKSVDPTAPERVIEEFMLEAEEYPDEFDTDVGTSPPF